MSDNKDFIQVTNKISYHVGFPKQTTSESRCRADEFGCYDGSCISSAWTCDDVSDCVMGEDENMELCKGKINNSTDYRKCVGVCMGRGEGCNVKQINRSK